MREAEMYSGEDGIWISERQNFPVTCAWYGWVQVLAGQFYDDKFSRHAKRRAKLYGIAESTVL